MWVVASVRRGASYLTALSLSKVSPGAGGGQGCTRGWGTALRASETQRDPGTSDYSTTMGDGVTLPPRGTEHWVQFGFMESIDSLVCRGLDFGGMEMSSGPAGPPAAAPGAWTGAGLRC